MGSKINGGDHLSLLLLTLHLLQMPLIIGKARPCAPQFAHIYLLTVEDWILEIFKHLEQRLSFWLASSLPIYSLHFLHKYYMGTLLSNICALFTFLSISSSFLSLLIFDSNLFCKDENSKEICESETTSLPIFDIPSTLDLLFLIACSSIHSLQISYWFKS